MFLTVIFIAVTVSSITLVHDLHPAISRVNGVADSAYSMHVKDHSTWNWDKSFRVGNLFFFFSFYVEEIINRHLVIQRRVTR